MIAGIFCSIALAIPILTFYIMDEIFMRRFARARGRNKIGRSWDFILFTILFNALIIMQPVLFPRWSLSMPDWWGLALQILGLVLLAGALSLHAWARLHLRQFYAERVEVLLDHQLIETGPYSLVRHPIITSFFGLALGLILVNPAIPTLVMLVYAFWDFGRAAVQEEKLLTRNVLGYGDYMARVPRFLPRLRRPK